MLLLSTLKLGFMQTNCYIVGSCGKCVVIDPAYDADKILHSAEESGYTIEKIFLTHAHFDHIMALAELQERTGAEVYIHENEIALLNNAAWNLSSQFAKNLRQYTGKAASVRDCDMIPVGNEYFKVMHTPGHTPGSVCYICEDKLFSGDTLFYESYGRYDFPGGSFSELKNSLQRLANLDGDYAVFPGHGPETSLSHERKFNELMVNFNE